MWLAQIFAANLFSLYQYFLELTWNQGKEKWVVPKVLDDYGIVFYVWKLVFVTKSFPLYTFIGCHVVSWKWTVIERMVFFLGVRYGPYKISPVSTQFTLRIMFGQFLLIQASGTCTGGALGYWKGAWANLALAIWYSWQPHELEPLLCAASNRHGHTVRDSVEHTHSILANARKWDRRKLSSRSRWRSTKISSKPWGRQ